MSPFFDHPPPGVLNHFAPHTLGQTWRRAPQGFSGAIVWRGDFDGTPRVALKAWPVGVRRERVRYIHSQMHKVAGLEFVPAVFASRGGATEVEVGGRVWDACGWVAGAPRLAPTTVEVACACAAVARLHAVWAKDTQRGPCPGVVARLRVLAENTALIQAGPDSLPPVAPELNSLLRDAFAAVSRRAAGTRSELQPWAQVPLALHPCVRDLRGEHVLFDGDRVSGIVDYGAAAVDHAALDLARLLADLGGGDATLWDAGLSGYRAARGPCDLPEELVGLLARAGAVCSLLGWLVRLISRREPVGSPAAVAARITSLLAQVQSFPGV